MSLGGLPWEQMRGNRPKITLSSGTKSKKFNTEIADHRNDGTNFMFSQPVVVNFTRI